MRNTVWVIYVKRPLDKDWQRLDCCDSRAEAREIAKWLVDECEADGAKVCKFIRADEPARRSTK